MAYRACPACGFPRRVDFFCPLVYATIDKVPEIADDRPTVSFDQYVLVGSTARSRPAWLFEHNMLLWQRV